MAAKPSSSFWHFLSRLAGLTALVAGIVGVVAWLSFDDEAIGFKILIGAAIVLALSLVPEALVLLRVGSSRRSAVGVNVAVQVALAAVLVVLVNVFSYVHYERYDCTRERIFTISDDVRQQLAKLQGVTDIVVLQQHISFGQSAGSKHDNYDAAAERKIVEKVKDLVEQFEELGPRFHVQVLDIEEEGFEDKVNAIGKKNPELAEAIKSAPDNSIFFCANGKSDANGKPIPAKVQRLGFHDVYQLDRQASKSDHDGRGNLVLNYQGLGRFVDKILNVEEKKPRVGVAVIHRVLGLGDDKVDALSLSGVKSVLEANGFNAMDVILRKGPRLADPDAFTFVESRFEQLELLRNALEPKIARNRAVLEQLKPIADDLRLIWDDLKKAEAERDLQARKLALIKLNENYILVSRPGSDRYLLAKMSDYRAAVKRGAVYQVAEVDEDDCARQVSLFDRIAKTLDADTTKLANARKEMNKLDADGLEEKQRTKDVRVKMNRVLQECDLLVIPRATLIDIPDDWAYPASMHRLHDPQLAALKDFIKSGKPVLFCLGSSSPFPEEPAGEEVDGVEKMLDELGFTLPRQTILFPAETDALAQKSKDLMGAAETKVESPAVIFQWDADMKLTGRAGQPTAADQAHAAGVPASLRGSLRFFQRSLGTTKGQQLKLRYCRPVYYGVQKVDPRQAARRVAELTGGLAPCAWIWPNPTSWREIDVLRFTEANTIMLSDPTGWNEDQPFPSEDLTRIPQYEKPATPRDQHFGTLAEKRESSFPIAAAAQVDLPDTWFPGRSQAGWSASLLALACDPFGVMQAAASSCVPRKDAKVTDRIVVIGNGSVFTGKQLNGVQQKLLLDTCNWLLGRESLLARDNETWQYPRVHFSDTSYLLWQWIARAAMPLAFVYLGIAVWLVRRMR